MRLPLFVFAASVVAIAMSPAIVAQAQSPATRPGPATPVEVTNTPENPVPVTGSLNVTGTANVTVTNTAANPVPVKASNLDDSVLNAFQERVAFGSGNPQSDKEFTVPAGKRLIIQSITFEADMATTQRPEVFLTMTAAAKFTVHYLPATFAGVDGTRDVYMGLHEARFFADGGTKVTVVCRTVAISGTGGCLIDMSVSGYLVDLP